MRRLVLFCLLASFVSATAAHAGVVRTESDDQSLTTTRMSVTPAAAPTPALRYRLLPLDLDRTPGNAAPFYYRALLQYVPVAKKFEKKYGADYLEWRNLPLDELPMAKLREVVAAVDSAILGQLREATRRQYCDWDFQENTWTGPAQYSFLLPEIQPSRQVARLLALRIRLAVAERRYDDAIETLQMGYQFAADTSQPLLLIAGLVGIAQAMEMNNQLTDLIAAPGSPNVYWALASQPRPLVDLRPSIGREMTGGLRAFPLFADAETAQHSPAEWGRILGQCLADLAQLGGSSGSGGLRQGWQSQLAATALAVKAYPAARRALRDDGMTLAQIDAMPTGQVIAIAAARAYRYMADEYEKWWYLPFWQAQANWAKVDAKLHAEGYLGDPLGSREIIPVGSLILPATRAARAAQVRLERDMAALQVIEAIRMHAAANNGQLPPTLAAITVVPVPLNPATGQVFEYTCQGDTAILQLPKSDGLRNARRYEVTLSDRE